MPYFSLLLGSIYSATFSPDNSKLLTASADKSVKLWDVSTRTLEHTFVFSSDPQLGNVFEHFEYIYQINFHRIL